LRPTLLALLGALLIAAPSGAQRLGPEVPRPRLPAAADTNDALVYLEHGMDIITEKAEEAANAFYWSARLDPSSPGALYGRRVALLMRRPGDLNNYMTYNRRARENKEFLSIDSLQLRAQRLNPMFYRSLDRVLLYTWYYNDHRRAGGTLSRAEFDREVQYILSSAPPATRAFLMYGLGQFDQAIDEYEAAIRAARNPISLRIERARVLGLRQRYGEAVAEFQRALTALKARDERRGEYVVFYDSKALLEHSIGLMLMRAGANDSARAAFGRAMTEDLAYFPAHLELGLLALSEKDTVTAVSELGLAAELAVDEPYVHYLYGSTLVATGQHGDAVAPLRKAIEMEPLYSLAYVSLGDALAGTGDKPAAKAAYERYLALAPRRETQLRADVTRKIAGLGQ
jgi:tetratricopeptide (TPR) repeat protein